MFRILITSFFILFTLDVQAKVSDFFHFFKVDMNEEYPDIKEFSKEYQKKNAIFDRGYEFRSRIGRSFKKDFSRKIKAHGSSESRIKPYYEDDLMDLLKILPPKYYQYVGPMLHEVPGMSEKILNMPGIKETKNQFPKDIAEKYKNEEDIEYLSPFLYFVLMPEIWDEPKAEDLDKPQIVKVKKSNKKVKLPEHMLEKIGIKTTKNDNNLINVKKEVQQNQLIDSMRTFSPTATSPLTSADVGAFMGTIDDIVNWGNYNNQTILVKFIRAEMLFSAWENEQGRGMIDDSLKDAVNPCQRLVQKAKFADLYTEFYSIVSKHGYTPEEWAYTCDKTIKAYRVADSNMAKATAIRLYNKGYYDKYIDVMPKKWRDEIYTAQAAIIKMHASTKNDVEVVRKYKDELRSKFMKNDYLILSAPIF